MAGLGSQLSIVRPSGSTSHLSRQPDPAKGSGPSLTREHGMASQGGSDGLLWSLVKKEELWGKSGSSVPDTIWFILQLNCLWLHLSSLVEGTPAPSLLHKLPVYIQVPTFHCTTATTASLPGSPQPTHWSLWKRSKPAATYCPPFCRSARSVMGLPSRDV